MPAAAYARQIRVGIGFSLPPYVIRETGKGLEVEVIRQAFGYMGHEVEFVYLPNLRLPVAFAQGKVDCVATNAAYDIGTDSGRKAYASGLTVVMRNSAITLPRAGIVLERVADLTPHSVLAFNNAPKYLGPEFTAMVMENRRYAELADQSLQVKMLYSGRVQVVVSDRYIFLWWRKILQNSTLAESLDLTPMPLFHDIFPPAPRCVFFSSSSLRDTFNLGLDQLRKRGEFDALVYRYIGEVVH